MHWEASSFKLAFRLQTQTQWMEAIKLHYQLLNNVFKVKTTFAKGNNCTSEKTDVISKKG